MAIFKLGGGVVSNMCVSGTDFTSHTSSLKPSMHPQNLHWRDRVPSGADFRNAWWLQVEGNKLYSASMKFAHATLDSAHNPSVGRSYVYTFYLQISLQFLADKFIVKNTSCNY